MLQNSYIVTLKIANTHIQHNTYDHHISTCDHGNAFIYAKELGKNKLLVINCQFISNIYEIQLFSFTSSSNGSVQFINCQFINNILNVYLQTNPQHNVKFVSLIKLYLNVRMEVRYCNFYADSKYPTRILQAHGSKPASIMLA